MSSFINVYLHYIFGTKNREPLIVPELKKRLLAYMSGIAKENNMKAIAINGTENHVHILISIPSTITIAKAIQMIKGGSSYWVHKTFPEFQNFEWQKGYGVFSVSQSNLNNIMKYIKNQEKHHAAEEFKQEYISLLKMHEIDYDSRYIWE